MDEGYEEGKDKEGWRWKEGKRDEGNMMKMKKDGKQETTGPGCPF